MNLPATTQSNTSSNENPIIVRRNELIHARYRMSLQEQRILLWLISQIRRDDTELKTYRISVRELAEQIGVENNHNLYTQIAQHTKSLMSRVAEIQRIGDDTLTQVQFLSKTKYYFGDGIVELTLNEHMRPYVLDLKERFTGIELKHAIKLSSFYALRIYEMLMAELYRGATYEIGLDCLRDRLGIAKDTLTRINNFKAKVLDIAEREINANTDLSVSISCVREGKRIGRVRFVMSKRGQSASNKAVVTTQPGNLLQRLTSFGMSSNEASRIITTWGSSDPTRISWHIDELVRVQAAGQIRKSPLAWLRAAIRDDYRAQRAVTALDRADRQREARLRSGSLGGPRTSETRSLGDLLRRSAPKTHP